MLAKCIAIQLVTRSALNVPVKEFKLARINVGSHHDSIYVKAVDAKIC